jgi:NAD+ synthase
MERRMLSFYFFPVAKQRIRKATIILSHMRPQLKEHAEPVIKEFIRQKVEESGAEGVVIGLSGGVDSALVARLSADAVGSDRVLCLFMPAKVSTDQDREDAQQFAAQIGAAFDTVDIGPAVEAFKRSLPGASGKKYLGNIMARCRMVTLFHYAKRLNYLVMGTSNKSELLVGYFTKFGDGGADFCPIGDLYKTEVRELAKKLCVPQNIIDKVPTAGLWKGQTDEGELGVSYDDLDGILLGLEMGVPLEDIASSNRIALKKVEAVWKMHMATVHKRKMPLIPKIGLRTVGLDWRE